MRNVLCETFCAKVLCETFCAKVLGETFWAKRFGQFFFGTTFCIWGWVLGRALVETFPGRPGTPKQVVRRVPRSVCGWNAWGISTLPAFALEIRMGLKHDAAPQFFWVLKGSREGACDGAPSAASFAA